MTFNDDVSLDSGSLEGSLLSQLLTVFSVHLPLFIYEG